MAFQFVNYAGLPPSGVDAFGKLLEGYKGGYEASQMPKVGELKQALLKAEIDKNKALARRASLPTATSMSTFGKALGDYQNIVKQYGEDSPQAKMMNDYLGKLSTGNQMNLSFDPETKALTFSQGSGSRGAGVSQLIDGKYVSTPTQASKTSNQKLSSAEVLRNSMGEFMNNPYVGTGSSYDIASDRIAYGLEKNPAKKEKIAQRLVDAAVADRLVNEYAAAQLSAQGVPATVPALEHQRQAIMQGWPRALKYVVNNLPKELSQRAKQKHDQGLKKLSGARAAFAAQGFPIDLKEKDQKEKKKIPFFDLKTGEFR